jgi:hypothetical protein
MSGAIQFLAAIGGKSPLSAADYAATVSLLDIDNDQKTALLDGDQAKLNLLLDGRAKLFFAVCAPDEREEPSREDDDVPLNPEPSPAAE